jgi:hypothetical protein
MRGMGLVLELFGIELEAKIVLVTGIESIVYFGPLRGST